MRKAFDKLAVGMALAGGLATAVLMVLMTADAIGRKLFGPLPGALEASEALMVAVVFLPLVYVQMKRQNIFVTIVTERLSKRHQAILDAASAFVGLMLFALITWVACEKAWEASILREYRVGLMAFPIWPFRWLVPLGTGMLALQLGLTVLDELRIVRVRYRR